MLHGFTIWQGNRIEVVIMDFEFYLKKRYFLRHYIMLCGLPQLKLVVLRDVAAM